MNEIAAAKIVVKAFLDYRSFYSDIQIQKIFHPFLR